MTPSALSTTVDFFTAQAVMASDYLVRLYRILGDDHQVTLAHQARGPCEERAQRLGLNARIRALHAVFVADHPDQTIGEERAWSLLVEAHAGLSAFHAVIDGHEKGKSLRGSRTATEKAFQKALRGYRVAFPEEMSSKGIMQAIEIAADKCSATFALDVEGATEIGKAEFRKELHLSVLQGLMQDAVAAP